MENKPTVIDVVDIDEEDEPGEHESLVEQF